MLMKNLVPGQEYLRNTSTFRAFTNTPLPKLRVIYHGKDPFSAKAIVFCIKTKRRHRTSYCQIGPAKETMGMMIAGVGGEE